LELGSQRAHHQLLRRMSEHQMKKTPALRVLHSCADDCPEFHIGTLDLSEMLFAIW
jgi:hypothetical protein